MSKNQSLDDGQLLEQYLEDKTDRNEFPLDRIESEAWVAYEDEGKIHVVPSEAYRDKIEHEDLQYDSLENLKKDLEQATHDEGRFGLLDTSQVTGEFESIIYDRNNGQAWIQSSVSVAPEDMQ